MRGAAAIVIAMVLVTGACSPKRLTSTALGAMGFGVGLIAAGGVMNATDDAESGGPRGGHFVIGIGGFVLLVGSLIVIPAAISEPADPVVQPKRPTVRRVAPRARGS